MPQAPLPLNEADRLQALRDYAILDTEGSAAFDDLVLVASHICGTEMATISLVDTARQWFLSRRGVTDKETPREDAFCAHTILEQTPLVVPDAELDPRFSDSPIVTTGQKIRFYAGAPLITPGGLQLGALCVLDQTPRSLTPEQIQALEALARQVVSQLELRKTAAELAQALSRVHTLTGLLPICAWCKSVRSDDDYWVKVEEFMGQGSDVTFTHGICPTCFDSQVSLTG